MMAFVWLVLFIGVPIALAFWRTSLLTATLVLGALLLAYTVLGEITALKVVLWILFVPLGLLNVTALRRDVLTRRLLSVYRRMLPKMSKTEQDALEAGNVWWEGEIFSGVPDWRKLSSLPAPRLTPEEQAFLDGPTEELCRMLDDWQITHELCDMPPEVWAYLKRERFFAMIIPKRYGGLEFSPLACSMVLAKIASRNATA